MKELHHIGRHKREKEMGQGTDLRIQGGGTTQTKKDGGPGKLQG